MNIRAPFLCSLYALSENILFAGACRTPVTPEETEVAFSAEKEHCLRGK